MIPYQIRETIHKLPGKVIGLVPKPAPAVTKGYHSRKKAGEICKKAGCRSVLIVTDKTLYSLGYHKEIVRSLIENGIKCGIYHGIDSEPTLSLAAAGRKAGRILGADAVIALGGGSVLDTCKMVAAGLKKSNRTMRSLLHKFLIVPGKTIPLICIPTTAGTGAEITVGAVVSVPGKSVKGSTVIAGLNVTDVILDSELTADAPYGITASCGIDALSHGLEGIAADISVSKEDMQKSMECVKIVLETLPVLKADPGNIPARQRMSTAALYGGNAINKQLAGYVHAFAHSIGAMYHIPHGTAIAMSLMPVMDFQKYSCLERLSYASLCCGTAKHGDSDLTAANRLLYRISLLIKEYGPSLPKDCIKKEDYPELVKRIIADSINYSAPLTLTAPEVEYLLDEIQQGKDFTKLYEEKEMKLKTNYTEDGIREIVAAQREYFKTGATLDIHFRISMLKRLRDAVIAHEEDFEKALAADLGRSRVEAFLCDIGPVITEVNEMIKGLRRWARPEKHFSGLMCFPSMVTTVYKMPYGVSLIISPFNFPILLTLGVLAASISGGNTAVIKASSKSPASTACLKKFIAETFPEKYITLIDGGHDVADMCLAQRFDKIFYTGSPAVGKHVLTEAAKNLTPAALELGGETGNWAIVRKDADLADAARKIAFFKLCNAGQICININQIAVAEEVADRFLKLLFAEFVRQIGNEPSKNPEYPKLITASVYDKCVRLTEQYKDRVVFGGKGDRETNRFDPTVIFPVDKDEEIVQSELFCPILPVVPFADSKIDEILETIADREHPLAMYLFTRDIAWANRVMQTQQYGGGCINEVCLHMMVKGVPFNGTGHSGMGAYHGKWGFMEFTHPSTVLLGSTRMNLSLREHPYTGKAGERKLKLLHKFEK